MRIVPFVSMLAILTATRGGFPQIPEAQVPEDWKVYTNPTYGYEIRYPPDLEVLPTGPEDLRDGRSIRISRKEYAAPTPILNLFVEGDPVLDRLPTGDIKDITVVTQDIEIGNSPAQQVTYRWKANGEILFVELSLERARFVFHANPGLQDIRDTVWWKIIRTFRFL